MSMVKQEVVLKTEEQVKSLIGEVGKKENMNLISFVFIKIKFNMFKFSSHVNLF